MLTLTARQAEILAWIDDFTLRNGFPPSGRELTDGCGLGSVSGAHRMIKTLQGKGFLEKTDGASRSLSLAEPPIDGSLLSYGDVVRLHTTAGMYMALADIQLQNAITQRSGRYKERIVNDALVLIQRAVALLDWLPGLDEDIDIAPYLADLRSLRSAPEAQSWTYSAIDNYILTWITARMFELVYTSDKSRRAIVWPDVRLYRRAEQVGQRWILELAHTGEPWLHTALDRVEPLSRALASMTGQLDVEYGPGYLSIPGWVNLDDLRRELTDLAERAG